MPPHQCVSHYHITLKDCDADKANEAAKLIGAKVTTIDLKHNPEEARDRMLTKYQKGTDLSYMNEDVALLERHGHEVIRYKLERMINNIDNLEQFIITPENYLEIHIKVPSTTARHKIFPFSFSSNPDSMDHFFYNVRARNLTQAVYLRDTIADNELLSSCPKHVEYTVFDSNPGHDRWWS